MKALLTTLLLATSAISVGQVGALPKNDVSLKEGTDPKFHPGDVWKYHTRLGEISSRLTILRIDRSPELGIIVHVGVDNIKFSNCTGGPEPDSVPHMPFAKRALEVSVTKRVASNQKLPRFEPGYEDWRDSYNRKQAGIYLVTVAQAVSIAEYTFRQGIGCEPKSEK